MNPFADHPYITIAALVAVAVYFANAVNSIYRLLFLIASNSTATLARLEAIEGAIDNVPDRIIGEVPFGLPEDAAKIAAHQAGLIREIESYRPDDPH